MDKIDKKSFFDLVDLVCDILDAGGLDIQKLVEFYSFIKRELDAEYYLDLEDLGYKIDFNSVMYIVMYEIVIYLAAELKEEEQDFVFDNLDISVNYIDSWFNNNLDNLDFSKATKEDALRELRNWIKDLKNKK